MLAVSTKDFHWKDYLFYNPDLVTNGIKTEPAAMSHFINFGALEGRRYNKNMPGMTSFDWRAYLEMNPDIYKAGVATESQAFNHYRLNGKHEGRYHVAVKPSQADFEVGLKKMRSFLLQKDAAGVPSSDRNLFVYHMEDIEFSKSSIAVTMNNIKIFLSAIQLDSNTVVDGGEMKEKKFRKTRFRWQIDAGTSSGLSSFSTGSGSGSRSDSRSDSPSEQIPVPPPPRAFYWINVAGVSRHPMAEYIRIVSDQDNVAIVRWHLDAGSLMSHLETLNQLSNVTNGEYFGAVFFSNSKVRGPFYHRSQGQWLEPYRRLLDHPTNRVGLVGATLTCDKQPHVQNHFFVLKSSLIPHVLTHHQQVYLTREQMIPLIDYYDTGLTSIVTHARYNVASMLHYRRLGAEVFDGRCTNGTDSSIQSHQRQRQRQQHPRKNQHRNHAILGKNTPAIKNYMHPQTAAAGGGGGGVEQHILSLAEREDWCLADAREVNFVHWGGESLLAKGYMCTKALATNHRAKLRMDQQLLRLSKLTVKSKNNSDTATSATSAVGAKFSSDRMSRSGSRSSGKSTGGGKISSSGIYKSDLLRDLDLQEAATGGTLFDLYQTYRQEEWISRRRFILPPLDTDNSPKVCFLVRASKEHESQKQQQQYSSKLSFVRSDIGTHIQSLLRQTSPNWKAFYYIVNSRHTSTTTGSGSSSGSSGSGSSGSTRTRFRSLVEKHNDPRLQYVSAHRAFAGYNLKQKNNNNNNNNNNNTQHNSRSYGYDDDSQGWAETDEVLKTILPRHLDCAWISVTAANNVYGSDVVRQVLYSGPPAQQSSSSPPAPSKNTNLLLLSSRRTELTSASEAKVVGGEGKSLDLVLIPLDSSLYTIQDYANRRELEWNQRCNGVQSMLQHNLNAYTAQPVPYPGKVQLPAAFFSRARLEADNVSFVSLLSSVGGNSGPSTSAGTDSSHLQGDASSSTTVHHSRMRTNNWSSPRRSSSSSIMYDDRSRASRYRPRPICTAAAAAGRAANYPSSRYHNQLQCVDGYLLRYLVRSRLWNFHRVALDGVRSTVFLGPSSPTLCVAAGHVWFDYPYVHNMGCVNHKTLQLLHRRDTHGAFDWAHFYENDMVCLRLSRVGYSSQVAAERKAQLAKMSSKQQQMQKQKQKQKQQRVIPGATAGKAITTKGRRGRDGRKRGSERLLLWAEERPNIYNSRQVYYDDDLSHHQSNQSYQSYQSHLLLRLRRQRALATTATSLPPPPAAAGEAGRRITAVDAREQNIKQLETQLPGGFDWRSYIRLNPELQGVGVIFRKETMEHYVIHGHKEGRKYQQPREERLPPGAENFDWINYLELNHHDIHPSLHSEAGAIQHFLSEGFAEARPFEQPLPTPRSWEGFQAKILTFLAQGSHPETHPQEHQEPQYEHQYEHEHQHQRKPSFAAQWSSLSETVLQGIRDRSAQRTLVIYHVEDILSNENSLDIVRNNVRVFVNSILQQYPPATRRRRRTTGSTTSAATAAEGVEGPEVFYLFNVVSSSGTSSGTDRENNEEEGEGCDNPLFLDIPADRSDVAILHWQYASSDMYLHLITLSLLQDVLASHDLHSARSTTATTTTTSRAAAALTIEDLFSAVFFTSSGTRGPLTVPLTHSQQQQQQHEEDVHQQKQPPWVAEFRALLDRNDVGLVGATLSCETSLHVNTHFFGLRSQMIPAVLTEFLDVYPNKVQSAEHQHQQSSSFSSSTDNWQSILMYFETQLSQVVLAQGFRIASMLTRSRLGQQFFDGHCPNHTHYAVPVPSRLTHGVDGGGGGGGAPAAVSSQWTYDRWCSSLTPQEVLFVRWGGESTFSYVPPPREISSSDPHMGSRRATTTNSKTRTNRYLCGQLVDMNAGAVERMLVTMSQLQQSVALSSTSQQQQQQILSSSSSSAAGTSIDSIETAGTGSAYFLPYILPESTRGGEVEQVYKQYNQEIWRTHLSLLDKQFSKIRGGGGEGRRLATEMQERRSRLLSNSDTRSPLADVMQYLRVPFRQRSSNSGSSSSSSGSNPQTTSLQLRRHVGNRQKEAVKVGEKWLEREPKAKKTTITMKRMKEQDQDPFDGDAREDQEAEVDEQEAAAAEFEVEGGEQEQEEGDSTDVCFLVRTSSGQDPVHAAHSAFESMDLNSMIISLLRQTNTHWTAYFFITDRVPFLDRLRKILNDFDDVRLKLVALSRKQQPAFSKLDAGYTATDAALNAVRNNRACRYVSITNGDNVYGSDLVNRILTTDNSPDMVLAPVDSRNFAEFDYSRRREGELSDRCRGITSMLKFNLMTYTVQPLPALGRVDLAAVFLSREKFVAEGVLFGNFTNPSTYPCLGCQDGYMTQYLVRSRGWQYVRLPLDGLQSIVFHGPSPTWCIAGGNVWYDYPNVNKVGCFAPETVMRMRRDDDPHRPTYDWEDFDNEGQICLRVSKRGFLNNHAGTGS